MSDIKQEKAKSILKKEISMFLLKEANKNSFITVMDIKYKKSRRVVDVICSVYPNTKLNAATLFLNRKERDCREYLKKNTRLKSVPMIRFKVYNMEGVAQ